MKFDKEGYESMHKIEFLRGFFEALRNIIEIKVTYKDGKTMKITFDGEYGEIDEDDFDDEEPVDEVYKDDCDYDGNQDDEDVDRQ